MAVIISDLSNTEKEEIHLTGLINIPLVKGDKGDKGDTGRSFRYLGEWDPFIEYGIDRAYIDVVTYQGALLACKRPGYGTTSGTPNYNFWDVMLPKGEKGDKGDTGDKGEQGEKGDKGDQGEPFTYEDLTEEQIKQLQSKIAKDVEARMNELQTENDILKNQIPTGKIGPAEYISIKDSANMPFEEINISGNDYQNISQILPGGYTQLDYIEATGTQYIDTGYLPKDTAKYELLGTVPENPTKTMYIFGENDDGYDTPEDQWGYSCYARVTTKGAMSFLFGHDSDWNGIQTKAISGYVGNKHKFVVDKEGLYVDNTLAQAYDETTIPFSKQKSLYLFALHYTDEDYNDVPQIGGGRIQVNNFKIYEDNVLIHDFIPCKRNSDSALGMYDYITKEFKTNAGTDTFVAGPVSVLPNKDYPIPSIYYPSEVRACGDNVNIFDGEVEDGGYDTSTGEKQNRSNSKRNVNFINVEGLNTIIFSNNGTGIAVNILEYDSEYKFIKETNAYSSNKAFNLQDNTSYINFFRGATNADKIKIEKGNTITSYSKHGQGSITFKKSNKNIFDGKLEKGTINTTTGINEHSDWSAVRSTNYINVNGLTEITLSLVNNSNTVIFYDKDKNVLSYNSVTNSNKRTVTLPANCDYIRYYEWTTDTTSNRQIEVGTVKTEYIEHQSKEYIVPTQQPMYKEDTFVKVDGVRYENHKKFRKIFDGTENFNFVVDATTQRVIYSDPTIAMIPRNYGITTKCSHFNGVELKSTIASTDVGVCQFDTAQELMFLLKNQYPNIVDKASWINFVTSQFNAGTPLYVDYVLAEPIYIECTEEQNAIWDEIEKDDNYKNVTIISSEDEVKPIISGVYYKDRETTDKNYEDRIAALEAAIIGG